MVFSSAVFMFAFFPVVFILHTAIGNITFRNILLVLTSLLFYAWGEPVYILLLLFSILFNYLMGKGAHKGKKAYVAAAVVVNIAFLVVFKYAGFLAETVNLLPFVNLPVPSVRMPIGISFYTFQALSYVIDTYRDKDGENAGFLDVMLYICLFPQLVAGPIVKYNTIRRELHDRSVTAEDLAYGIRRFIVGLSKKMLIANTMGACADRMFALSGELDCVSAWLGAITYMLQIYFDFLGYSDMALGMGRCFGFEFPENFNYPYIAVSIRDFWKRWHISLTSWFREYLYFPLGGNRKGRARTVFNRFFVFLCTGIWHGANMTFLVWGIYHGLLTMLETLVNFKTEKRWERALGHVYTLLAVMIGFVIFRADNMGHALRFIVSMFSFGATAAGTAAAFSMLTPLFVFTLLVAVLASVWSAKVDERLAFAGSVVLYMLCIVELAAGSYNPFIYFRF